ncbi:Ger(x)C family spore germination protein [Metabacillus idriensis]|uniref:Ger(x)C family spore germination protein n=1 Tax=Metabacillus idriensis TaxID=324768 RepID=UPI002813E3B9|nr:Ger(x)C family spore germination protein [Metabacillus idriensis]MDR0140182.1 Ger(x)C family spore germination protein [Metabacillus idriensis]
MRRGVFLLKCLFICIVLTGCWDQEILAKKALVNGISFDKGENGKILGTVRVLKLVNKGGGQFEAIDELISSEGLSANEIGQSINMMTSGQLDTSKANIVIIGEEIAKEGIIPLLEPFYRSKRAYLSSKVIIGKGSGVDILATEKETSPIAFEILQLIESAESSSVTPEVSIFSLWSDMNDPGKDIMVPIVEKTQEEKIKVAGLAFFNGGKYSGLYITDKEAPVLMLLLDKLRKRNSLEINIKDQEERMNPLTFSVKKVKRRVKTDVDEISKEIKYSIDLSISVSILSYPNHSNKEVEINKLDKQISSQLTQQAEQITEILQEANCDVLSIGRNIESDYPELWKRVEWKGEYKNVKIKSKIKVKIIDTGTLY